MSNEPSRSISSRPDGYRQQGSSRIFFLSKSDRVPPYQEDPPSFDQDMSETAEETLRGAIKGVESTLEYLKETHKSDVASWSRADLPDSMLISHDHHLATGDKAYDVLDSAAKITEAQGTLIIRWDYLYVEALDIAPPSIISDLYGPDLEKDRAYSKFLQEQMAERERIAAERAHEQASSSTQGTSEPA